MKLNRLQIQFAESLFYRHDEIVKQIKETQQVTVEQRLQVYRNSFIMGISEALSITYQHTLALVGEDFFNTVSREFILTKPPHENNIIIYGAGFNDYLNNLPQLASMPYISEMARFEWLLEQTSNTEVQEKQLDISRLAQLAEDSLDTLLFTIPTQVTLFHSEKNISHLYQMLINDEVVETDLNTPCYIALKKQPDFRIELIQLNKNEFNLLQQIKMKRNLGEITPTELHQELPMLLEKALINGFLHSDNKMTKDTL